MMDVCRLCLSKSPDKHIHQLKTSKKYGEKSYQEILPFCLDIMDTEEVQITKKICTKCFQKVLTFYKFKCMALENDAYLKSRISKVLVKCEPVEEEEVYLPQALLGSTQECVQYVVKLESDSDQIEIDTKPESPYVDDHFHHSHDYQQNINDYKHEIKIENKNIDSKELLTNQTGNFKNIKTKNEDVKTQSKISSNKKVEIKTYPCEYCGKVFNFSCRKSRHIRNVHMKIKSHCNICNKDVLHLNNHTRVMHEQHTMKHECPTCNRRFISKTRLNQHKCKLGSEVSTNEFKCSRCNTKFEDNSVLLLHTRTEHKDEKKFLCDFCSNGFFRKSHLVRHIENLHSPKPSNTNPTVPEEPIIRKTRDKNNEKPKSFPCDLCSKVLSNRRTRNKHIKYVHGHQDGLKIKCSICDKSVLHLKQHMRSHGEQTPTPYECKLCARRFVRAHKLRDHACKHAADATVYHCPEPGCDKTFLDKHKLRKHERKIHKGERDYMCHYCSKGFFCKWRLIRHIRCHTKEKPYPCTVCNSAFSCRKSLNSHMDCHKDKADFECQVCFKRFVSVRYLRNHMVIHGSEKKYPCKYCGVRFVRSDHRKRHQFTAHEKYTAMEHS